MKPVEAQVVLTGIALGALGVIGGLLVYQAVPQNNQQLLGVVLGALAGALTTAISGKIFQGAKDDSDPKPPTS